MSKYFDYSQEVRKQIESDSNLMGRLREHYETEDSRTLESLKSGEYNVVWQVGKLDSGLCVALREINESRDFESQLSFLRIYESYCENAEKLFEEGKRVPNFCIGVSCGRGTGLLVEDLTEGGKRELWIPRGSLGVGNTPLIFSDTQEEVYVDLDDIDAMTWTSMKLKYMKKENMINL